MCSLMSNFEWKIHHTGSSGNSATIKVGGLSFLIDYGKSYKTISKYMDGIDFVLTSHVHSDHLNLSAYKGIRQNYSHVQFITNQEVSDKIASKNISPLPEAIIKAGDVVYLGEVTLYVFENVHGVECNGYIFEYENEYLLFATDLSTMIFYSEWLDEHNVKLDICLLEANYDPEVIQFYEQSKEHTGFDIFSNGSFRHLPTTEHNAFVAKYLKEGGVCKELHISSTYHDFNGLIGKSKGRITQEDVNAWKRTQN